MKKNLEYILKYYLIFNSIVLLINSVGIAKGINNISPNQEDTVSIITKENKIVEYPGKPLLMSLILPGAGQYYNSEPIWKSGAFLGIELTSILTWAMCNNRAATIKDEFQSFADKNWTLENWVSNKLSPPSIENNGRRWSQFSALMNLTGTHDLILVLDGALKEQYGPFVSSDSLEVYPYWAESSEVTIARDRHFYENIGKYDQFLGGWSDASSDWYWEEKDVGDTVEIVIKTPYKNNYLNQRQESNEWLSIAKFSISALMFNHILSGMDAVLSNQRKSIDKVKQSNKIDMDFSLLYNPKNFAGVGGLSFTILF